MKKILFLAAGFLLISAGSIAQRICGQQLMMEQMELAHPGFRDKIAVLKKQTALNLAAYKAAQQAGNWSTAKTTAAPTIPVVFHVILDSSQVATIGGIAGLEARLNSQIAVLNEDFNGANADATKVPAVWKPLFANAGIRFGLAHTGPDGSPTRGYDIRYVAKPSSFGVADACRAAKLYSTGGLDSWDNTRYLNIWLINISMGSITVYGYTAPPGLPEYTTIDYGIALNYLSCGRRSSASDIFLTNADLGRSLSHEMGHFFHLWHVWGDDGGLCPGDPGGDDDGIADTPPQADASYGANVFPKYDACSPAGSSSGIMFMNYLDYSDDAYLYMFTQDQAAVMNLELAPGGNSYSLTQHPELSISETTVSNTGNITISPNPSTGLLRVNADVAAGQLQSIQVLDMTGRVVASFGSAAAGSNMDISHLTKGLYLVQCHFDRGTITKKIVLQ